MLTFVEKDFGRDGKHICGDVDAPLERRRPDDPWDLVSATHHLTTDNNLTTKATTDNNVNTSTSTDNHLTTNKNLTPKAIMDNNVLPKDNHVIIKCVMQWK